MKTKMIKTISSIALSLVLGVTTVGCAVQQAGTESTTATQVPNSIATTSVISADTVSDTDTSELFSDRDLEQSPDLSAAKQMTLENDKDVTLTEEGVYVLSGEVTNVTVVVDAADDAKVQIILDGVSITNEDSPAIYVKAADKVFITTTDSTNYMEVSGSYVADGDTNLDAVIFSQADITLNGTGTLEIVSSNGNGISSKDELKITGGVYNIQSSGDAIEANDSIVINDGDITINAGADALQSENAEDSSLGYIYIVNGTFNITAADDAIRGNSYVTIDGGTINIVSCEEGLEANIITINGGQITLYAQNDGINAAPKVDGNVSIEVNGGTLNISIGSGDTDAFDSNGDIYINGGTIAIQATSAFDADGTAQLNAGTVTVNGETITQITQSNMAGGGKHG